MYSYDATKAGVLPGPRKEWGTGLSLSSLSKAYWLGKSIDWTVNLSYAFADSLYTDSGTVVGSGTYDLSDTTPAQRIPSWEINSAGLPASVAGTLVRIDGSLPDQPYAFTANVFSFAWFRFLGEDIPIAGNVDPISRAGRLVKSSSPDTYYSYANATITDIGLIVFGGIGGLELNTNDTLATAITLKIKVGTETAVFPAYFQNFGGIRVTGSSGEIVLDVNQFWPI